MHTGCGLPEWHLLVLSVLIFHQGVAALLHALELTPREPYALQPTRPLGVPVLRSITFWGAVWGALLAASLAKLDGARRSAAVSLVMSLAALALGLSAGDLLARRH